MCSKSHKNYIPYGNVIYGTHCPISRVILAYMLPIRRCIIFTYVHSKSKWRYVYNIYTIIISKFVYVQILLISILWFLYSIILYVATIYVSNILFTSLLKQIYLFLYILYLCIWTCIDLHVIYFQNVLHIHKHTC